MKGNFAHRLQLKASKALPVSIDLELFSRIFSGTKSLVALTVELDIAENRLDMLLTALTSIGLFVRDAEVLTADLAAHGPMG